MGCGMSGGARCVGWVLASVRGGGLSLLALSVVLGLWGVGLAGSASALPSNCSQSGNTVTCTYTGAGTYTFTVPVGVSSLDVTAVGAAGGGPGGPGASVEDTNVPVSA